MLNGNDTLACQVLDLLRAVLLPVLDICVIADPQWATSEDDRADIVIEASGADGLLVGLGGTGLVSKNESCANPYGAGAEHQGSSNRLSIVDPTSGNDLHGLASHWAGPTLAELNNRRDQNGCRNITSVSTTLSSLGADDINAEIEALLDVFGVANHVHVQDTGLVESVDDMLWGDTNGRNEQLCSALNNNGNELVQLALGIIIAFWYKVSG
jgi:hypothetical protein